MSDTKAQQPGVSALVLAHLWACETRQVELLAKKGIAIRIARGRYDAAGSTRNYIKHLREQAAGRLSKDPNVDSVAAGARHKEAATKLLELKYQRETGELLPAAFVVDTWTKISRGVRNAILALPNRIAAAEPTLSNFARVAIEKICCDTLEGLALGRGMELGEKKVSGRTNDRSRTHAVSTAGPKLPKLVCEAMTSEVVSAEVVAFQL